MELVFLGPPGAGKGTQAKLASAHLGVPHLSTGDLLRRAVRDQTELGRKAQRFMHDGTLVPDGLIDTMIEVDILADTAKAGFVLDGYPRNRAQADVLDDVLTRLGRDLTRVIVFDVPDRLIEDRLTGRRSCTGNGCGSMYHIEHNPPKTADQCDRCGSPLILRDDDRAELVRDRLGVYHELTEPLLKFYAEKKLLFTVDGVGSLESVHASVLQAVEGN